MAMNDGLADSNKHANTTSSLLPYTQRPNSKLERKKEKRLKALNGKVYFTIFVVALRS